MPRKQRIFYTPKDYSSERFTSHQAPIYIQSNFHDIEGAIEPGAEIFQSHRSGQFNQLLFVESLQQSLKELCRYKSRCL